MLHVIEIHDDINNCKSYINSNYIIAMRHYPSKGTQEEYILVKIHDGNTIKVLGEQIDVVLSQFKGKTK